MIFDKWHPFCFIIPLYSYVNKTFRAMKRLFITLIYLSCSLMAQAQSPKVKDMMAEIHGQYQVDDNGNVTYVDLLENLTLSKDEIYTRAKSFFIFTYNDADEVIQDDNKEAGTIIGKCIFKNIHAGYNISSVTYDLWHILRIDAKDGRARIMLTLTDYNIVSMYGGAVSRSSQPVSKYYPINPGADNKTMTGKAFYNGHHRARELMIAAIDAIINGSTSAGHASDDW